MQVHSGTVRKVARAAAAIAVSVATTMSLVGCGVMGSDDVTLDFFQFKAEAKNQFETLARQFEKLRAAMFENGDLNTIKANPQYIEEGSYTMPLDYNLYEESRSLLDELDRLANEIRTGGRVGVKSYDRFISYQNRVKKLLQTYSEKNPEESSKVLEAMNRLNNICVSLRTLDQQFNIIEKNAGQSKPEDIRRLRDVLDGYAEK